MQRPLSKLYLDEPNETSRGSLSARRHEQENDTTRNTFETSWTQYHPLLRNTILPVTNVWKRVCAPYHYMVKASIMIRKLGASKTLLPRSCSIGRYMCEQVLSFLSNKQPGAWYKIVRLVIRWLLRGQSWNPVRAWTIQSRRRFAV